MPPPVAGREASESASRTERVAELDEFEAQHVALRRQLH